MEKFYQWTLTVELLQDPPFQFEQQHPTGSVAVVGAKEKVVRHRGDVRFLSLSRYTTFRDVGLRGLAPGGAEDQGFANRCGARNAAFADLCVPPVFGWRNATAYWPANFRRSTPATEPGPPGSSLHLR
jgi:hypothetical protein